MAVVKSDAMVQHEKWIEYVISTNPKWIPGKDKPVNLMPEAHILVAGFAALAVVVAVAISLFT
jgi:hypothetical protein